MNECKYVPIEPTAEMIEASKGFVREWHPVDIENLYKAMIAAAPDQAEWVCKGSVKLGTGCGKCSRCRSELAENRPSLEYGKALEYALEEIRESLDDLTITHLNQVATGIRDLKEKLANYTEAKCKESREVALNEAYRIVVDAIVKTESTTACAFKIRELKASKNDFQ